MYRTSKQIHNKIIEANHIILVPHKNPDGDALGSLTAFKQYLCRINKPHTSYCATDVPENFKVLHHVDSISSDDTIWQNTEVDLVVVFDAGDTRYAGIDVHLQKLPKKVQIINIDHHVTNENYGHINMVITDGSSTAETLYNFFKHNNIALDNIMATSLLAGLITDTDFYTNSATSLSSLQITAKLISLGGDFKLIKDIVFKNKTVQVLKLWGVVLSRLKKHETLDLVYTYMTQNDLTQYGISEEVSDGISNFMNNLNDGEVCLLLKEMPEGDIKGSFRTTKDNVDVSAIAKQLGGGGHKKAAGFTIDGPLKKAAQEVFETIKACNM
ncbi:MAG: DHH family phosphoesterase [bacterium]|nr:DHH family phosphoesterase [bacterium]